MKCHFLTIYFVIGKAFQQCAELKVRLYSQYDNNTQKYKPHTVKRLCFMAIVVPSVNKVYSTINPIVKGEQGPCYSLGFSWYNSVQICELPIREKKVGVEGGRGREKNNKQKTQPNKKLQKKQNQKIQQVMAKMIFLLCSLSSPKSSTQQFPFLHSFLLMLPLWPFSKIFSSRTHDQIIDMQALEMAPHKRAA